MKRLSLIELASSVFVIFLANAFLGPPALAQGPPVVFGPEHFTRSAANKDNFSGVFSTADTSIPYTLTIQNGNDDGTLPVRKGWITLNGQELLAPPLVGSQRGRLILAIHPQQQNELDVKLKGGHARTLPRISAEPTPSSALSNPGHA